MGQQQNSPRSEDGMEGLTELHDIQSDAPDAASPDTTGCTIPADCPTEEIGEITEEKDRAIRTVRGIWYIGAFPDSGSCAVGGVECAIYQWCSSTQNKREARMRGVSLCPYSEGATTGLGIWIEEKQFLMMRLLSTPNL